MSDSRLQSGKIQGGHETLTRIINDLRSKEERIRLKAANNLHQYISSESREISGEAFTKFMEGVSRRIFELVSSSDINEKMGGILAIDKMIDIDFEESATKITRFANYLRPVFPNNDATLMVMASKVLGHLAHAAGTLTADFVEFELKRALEWLQSERNEAKRHASVLILKELAENSGILFYTYIEQFLESIWPSLRDPKLTIREAAVDALRACFSLIALRDTPQRAAWYRKIFEEAQRGIEKANVDSVHGSLLAIGELIRNSSDFMVSHFRDMCDLILRHREHRDRLIKRTVIVLLPRLAEFSVAHNHVREVKSAFQESLDIAMQLLFKALSKDGDRSFAYISLAEMISAMQQFNAQYLDEIIARIKDGLANKTKKTYFVEAVSCVSVLARAVKDQLKPHAVGLLDNLGYTPLSQSLIDAMSDMALYIPDLLSDIQSRLIQRFKTILSALSSRQLVSPQQRRLTVGALSSPLAQANLLDMVDTDSIILAIKTLGTFNFRGHMLIDFARDVVLSYTDDDNPLIRKEAALTCSKLLSSPDQSAPTKGQAAIVIGEVLAKLLTVAISDPDPSIRSTIFSSFDPRLDHHLAQPENLNSLFIALNDEVFEIRGLAISLMGRLALRNPAFVMPTLRKTLIQLMTELEYSGDLRNKEESAQLLACLIRSSHRLTKPYMEPVLKAIVPKLREGSQGLSIWILDVLGALAEVSGEEMCAYFDELMPMVMEAMQDQSSGHKREVALTTLRQLVLSTGKAITPYTKYPQLLNILLQMLKTELSGPIRTEVLKVLGTLGAFDPYRHKVNQLDTQGRANHVHVHSHKQDEIDSTLDLLPGMGSSSEEYCPTVAISALMRILRDPSLSIHHTSVIQAVMYIFKNLGTKSVPFLPYVMPPFLQVMRTCEAQFREYLFTQLGQLVGIVKQHIKKYLDDIFALIHENWLGLINHILPLVEGISLALNDEFKVYLPDLIPMMLNVLHTDRSERRSATQKVLHAFEVFGANLDDYLHLVIPAVVRLFEQVDAPVNVRLNAIQTLAKLSRKLDFSDYASRIIHPLARVLDVTYHELRREAMETFCVLVYQLGPDYAIFAPKVNKVLAKQRIQHARYEQLVSKLLKNQRLPQDGMEFDDRSDLRGVDDSPLADSLNTKKLNVHQANLKKTWEVTQCSNKEDWIDWSRRFALELLRESSSPALRACSALAQVYPTLSRELFNAGFVSCWTELHEANQDSLVTSLESALKSSTIPPEILQVLLNLAEFMEHDDKPLPIDIKTLGTLAEKCHAYAKALHYKEIEFHSSPNTLSETIEALISINNQLQQPEAADGILKYAESTMERVSLIKESWYEKLHRWRDALEAYGRRQLEDPQSAAVAMGMMRCYNALGEWDPLAELTETHWALVDDEQRRTIAPLAASAAWNLGAWDHLEKYVLAIDEKSIDGCFFRAILSLHLGEYERAQLFIDSARVKLDTELTALIGESYDRAYNQVVKVQQLTELEEMILYKRSSSLPEMQYTIRKLWNERLAGCQRNVEFWQQLLGIRSLVLEPHESIDMHIKFASLCRKSGRLSMSSKSLMKLLGGDSTNLPPNRVGYAYIKHMWDAGAKDVAIDKLKVFVQHSEDDTKLRARCHLLLGRWQQAQDDGFQESTVTEIMHHYRMATEYDSAWYKAWHAWALSNFEVANHHFKNHVTPEKFSAYVVSAVQGFFRSIALGPGGSSSLQDTLRLLTLWFQFGSFKDVEDALKDGFPTVSIDTWLQVIPQLIARIHSGAAPVRRLVHDLLSTVGKEHPQALIYPLTVASKSQAESRKNAALDILNKMRQHSAVLVEQAVLVSQELIRVAIIWHEMWHEGLEEASRLYFGDHNVEGMFDILKPLHEMMDRVCSSVPVQHERMRRN
eukprot:TRINITY_DN5657_c0_g1_i3.p1 TRINITY_DN5657_c0_g1~~TRINITY_DN5657_c0_g1_i3.p1  ORF type:complete len:1876 (-),score=390.71 TRINITY_DN5657_c0_g1_i3:1816-7443(-)